MPGVVDHAKRPPLAALTLTDARRRHILEGDAGGSGGHRHGTGRPLKTEFPATWDDATTTRHVRDVARHPDVPPVMQGNGKWRAQGTRDGVDVTVIIRPDGQIVTAYPEPGERGVRQNPE